MANPLLTDPFPPHPLTIPEVIARYRTGESMLSIAQDSPVKARQLYNWILKEVGEEQYRDIQTECLMNRVADADTDLLKAEDTVQVARAREVARFARFDLERRRPALYGPKQEVNSSQRITIIVQRGIIDPRATVREPEASQVSLDQPGEVIEIEANEPSVG